MKKIFISVLAMAAFVLSVSAQQKVYVWQADGNVLELNVSNIDSISFTAPNPNVSRSVATFEDVALGEQGFWNGSDLSGEEDSGNYYGSFTSSVFSFDNIYTAAWGSYMGFACSSLTDTVTSGFTNQYSPKAGEGANGSAQFALAYENGATFNCTYKEGYTNNTLKSVMITNGTYVYNEIRDGGAYSKKFESGDWFKVTFTGYKGEAETGSVDYYLADFRDGKTYINKEWVEIDLTPLADATTVMIAFDSTDKGDYGVNTPKYVFIDNLTIEQTK
ncbi:MAG: DUF4465 domain-containing protein [Bacteroidetes bacterium]|uniref:DUF4465 domain-containing protein n=1 Tax=Candidatus Gallipaludibacter merdavium TaxID=2840839 RepID=A0A9D9N3C2_9BACT|nr:DUF4465 domain-containing protein [Candidatus Gallipaludibacter merdavium]